MSNLDLAYRLSNLAFDSTHRSMANAGPTHSEMQTIGSSAQSTRHNNETLASTMREQDPSLITDADESMQHIQ